MKEETFCYSSNDPYPRIDALLTTFVEGIGYIQEHPDKREASILLMDDLLMKIHHKAESINGLLIKHIEEMKMRLDMLKGSMDEKHFEALRKAALIMQNELMRL